MLFVRLVLVALLFFALPFTAYRAGAFWTDHFFRTRLVPYPSDALSLVAGLAAAAAALGLSFFVYALLPSRRKSS